MSNQNFPIQHLLFGMDILPLDGDHLRNNNNQNNLWQLRDRLFQVLFERATLGYANTIPHRLRKCIEFLFLVLAVISLFTLTYIHVAFVQVPVNCLETETLTWSREGVLRVEISLEEPSVGASDVPDYCNADTHHVENFPHLPNPETPSVVIVDKPPTITIEIHKDEDSVLEAQDVILDAEKSPEFINRTLPFKDSVHDPDCLSPLKTILSDIEMFSNTVWTQEEYIIEYSLEYGFLRLSAAARHNTSVKVHTVTLDPNKDQCFGNPLSQFLLKYIVGYGDVLMSSLRYLVDKDENKGFVRNVVTGDQYRFVDKSTTWTAYFSSAFIMMVFTLSISMLLRYSHHQIFMFIVELLHVFEYNTSVSFPAAPLLTVVLALVGMEAIMSEFFNDSTTAFYIILIVWVADQYDTICCHTPVTKRHWLRFFYLYHFAFYAYHYRFNGQYSSLALVTSWLFIQHSMLFFFHRYELPAVQEAQELDSESDDSLPSESEALMPSSEVLPTDTVSSSTVEGSLASQESDGRSVEVSEPQENGTSSIDASTVRSENNNVKRNSKQTDRSSRQENNSNLLS